MTEEPVHPQRFVLPKGGRGRLVLDTTEVTRDWLLRGLAFRVLRHLREVHMLEIAVPAVVIAEVEANHASATEHLDIAVARVRRAGAQLGLPDPVIEQHPLTAPYGYRLAEALESLDAEVLPWPSAAHADVVSRAVRRLPPFDATGGGYRDTLVWLSALEHAAPGDRLFLASNDKAFAQPKGLLAPSLVTEAADQGVEAVLVPRLGAWVLEQLPWAKDLSLPEVAAEVRDDRFATHLMYSDFPSDIEFEPDELGLPGSTRIVDVLDAAHVRLERTGVKRLGPGETLVEYDADVDLRLLVEMDATEADSAGLAYSDRTTGGWVEAIVESRVTISIGASYDEHDAGTGWFYSGVQLR